MSTPEDEETYPEPSQPEVEEPVKGEEDSPSQDSGNDYEAPSQITSSRPTRTANLSNNRPTQSWSRTRRPRPTSGWWNREDNAQEGSVQGQGSEYEAPAEDAAVLPDYQENAVEDPTASAAAGEKPCKNHMNMNKRAGWKRHFGH